VLKQDKAPLESNVSLFNKLWSEIKQSRSEMNELSKSNYSNDLFVELKQWHKDFHALAALNFSLACTNVILDASAKRVRIFTYVPRKSNVKQIKSFRIEIVCNPKFNHNGVGGTYDAHHNAIVASFAAVQIYEGDRELGRNILQIITDVCPDVVLSEPDLNINGHPVREILKKLDANDPDVQKILVEEKRQWQFLYDEYGSVLYKNDDSGKSSGE
jgi:hypothetical protein